MSLTSVMLGDVVLLQLTPNCLVTRTEKAFSRSFIRIPATDLPRSNGIV